MIGQCWNFSANYKTSVDDAFQIKRVCFLSRYAFQIVFLFLQKFATSSLSLHFQYLALTFLFLQSHYFGHSFCYKVSHWFYVFLMSLVKPHMCNSDNEAETN